MLGLIHELEDRPPTKDEVLTLFSACEKDGAALDALCGAAALVRDRLMVGRDEREAAFNSVTPCHLRPLCLYCPYWRDGHSEPMTPEEAVGFVRQLHDESDIRQFHLSGGCSAGSGEGRVLPIVRAIREAGFDDMRIVVNCGPSFDDKGLEELASLGVLRVFSVFETTNPEVFKQVKPGDNLNEKLKFATRIARHGIGVGTGLMAGLGPRETRWADYTKSLFGVGSLTGLEVLYVSKFRHAPGIEMNDHPECDLDEARAFLAMARLVLRDVHVRAAAGWGRDERLVAKAAGEGSISVERSFQKVEGACWG